MFSYQAIWWPQCGHRERGATTDSPRGTRWMTTFKKLPLLEAVEGRQRMHLLVASTDTAELLTRPRAFAGAGNIHFLRPDEDISPFLFALDAFVHLSDSEGLGSAALLAMAHGLPVVASNVGGLPEIVLEGETGLLVENQTREVGAALEKLLADRELAAGRGPWLEAPPTRQSS